MHLFINLNFYIFFHRDSLEKGHNRCLISTHCSKVIFSWTNCLYADCWGYWSNIPSAYLCIRFMCSGRFDTFLVSVQQLVDYFLSAALFCHIFSAFLLEFILVVGIRLNCAGFIVLSFFISMFLWVGSRVIFFIR